MPAETDILDRFPELRFPQNRGAVTVSEIAEKWAVSDEHVVELLDTGELHPLFLTGLGNKTSRKCIRIPVSSYYEVTRDRLRHDWVPPHRPDKRQPELF